MARTVTLALALVAALSLACPKDEVPKPKGLGKRIAAGPVAALRASPDGAFVAWLTACAPVSQGFVPRGTQVCELRVAPVAGGEAKVVARGVTSLPHGFAWTPEGTLLALAGYDHLAGAGQLVAWDRSGTARTLGDGVSFYAAAPGGRVGWVAKGALHAGTAAAAGPIAGATRVATFEFSPEAKPAQLTALARRESAAGGELLAVEAGGAIRTVATRAGDYRFSSRGDYAYTVREGDVEALAFARDGGKSAPVRRNVQSFAFAPGGGAVAFVSDLEPGKQGDLWVARLPTSGSPGAPEKLGEGVGDYRWASAAPRLAWLEGFDPATRAGALHAGAPGEKPVRLGERVSSYDLSPDGSRIAFLEHVLAGGYSVDLKLAHLGGGGPRVEEIAKGVFGFELTPERDALWYRTACVRDGESCDLYRVPSAGLAGGAKPELLARGVKSFDFDRRRPGRALLGWPRESGTALDLGVWDGGKVVKVDQGVLAGSGAFLGASGAELVYAVAEKGREGVYVAEVGK